MKVNGSPWRSVLGTAGVVLVIAFLSLLMSPKINRVSEDESTMVYDGQRVAQGQVPYRDFFSFCPPGTFYLLAASSKGITDRPETAGRYMVLVAALLSWAGCYVLLRRVLDGLFAYLLSALFPVCIYPFASYSPHHWLGTCSLVWAAVVAAKLLDQPTRKWGWILLGSCAGLTGWFMQTEGALCAVMILLAALVTSKTPKVAAQRLAYGFIACAATSALLWSPVILAGGVTGAWADVIAWPISHYDRPGNPNDLPLLVDLPGRVSSLWKAVGLGHGAFDLAVALSGTLLYAAIALGACAALVAAICVLVSALARRKLPSGFVTVASMFGLLTAGSFAKINPTWVHLVYVLLPSIPFFIAASVGGRATNGKGRRTVLFAAVLLLACGVVYHGRALVHHFPHGWELVDVDRVDRESPLNRSLREGGLLRKGDTLVVLPSGGNVYLYTAPAAIGYTYLFPLQDRYHDLHDHWVAARQILERKPRIVIIHKVRYAAFMVPKDPLSAVLKERYARIAETPAVVVLGLRGSRPEVTPEEAP